MYFTPHFEDGLSDRFKDSGSIFGEEDLAIHVTKGADPNK